MQEVKILLVCKGNICRSPFAAALIENENISLNNQIRVKTRSAGTEDFNTGKNANNTAIEVAKEFGINLSGHIARQVILEDVLWADYVVLMDRENLARLKELFPNIPENVPLLLLGDYLDTDQTDIPDPYRKDIEVFRISFQLIVKACRKLLLVQKV